MSDEGGKGPRRVEEVRRGWGTRRQGVARARSEGGSERQDRRREWTRAAAHAGVGGADDIGFLPLPARHKLHHVL